MKLLINIQRSVKRLLCMHSNGNELLELTVKDKKIGLNIERQKLAIKCGNNLLKLKSIRVECGKKRRQSDAKMSNKNVLKNSL